MIRTYLSYGVTVFTAVSGDLHEFPNSLAEFKRINKGVRVDAIVPTYTAGGGITGYVVSSSLKEEKRA